MHPFVRTVLGAALAVSFAAPGVAAAQLRATLVASGFTRPLGLVQDPTDPGVQMVLEQAGRIRVLQQGVVQPDDFLDLTEHIASGGERGLLGLAFAPDYAQSGRLFVCFTDRSGNSVVARFRRSAANPLRADPASRFDLLWPDGRRSIEQPFSNHNGGHLAFGPDLFLYVGLGDGGSGNDPMNHAQNPRSLLGKMLRLNVLVSDADPEGYDVPATNPFVGRADVLAEIWSFGWRNPWRWSFDDHRRGGTGALLVADVGQNRWEEINYEPAGAGGRNYGWRIREGAHDNVTSAPPFVGPLREPIWEYGHGDGRSVTGGYVYRGTSLGSTYVGRYFFADFVASRVWSIALVVDPATREAAAGTPIEHTPELATAAMSPASFGIDASGELYLVSYGGAIYRIEGPPGQTPAPEPPAVNPGVGPRRNNGDSRGRAEPRRP
jgi:glucose/arabinose dehydrogenase